MPIDTTEKKLSLMNMGLPWVTTLPYADGSLDQGDEQHLLNLYSGILAEAGEITVAVVDNADGTATVTITDSGAGDTNTVYVCQVEHPVRLPRLWASAGSRVGDGTVDITTGKGVFWVYVSSDAGAPQGIQTSTVNNGDGTATVTIAGSGGASNNIVYYAQVDSTFPEAPMDWTSGGSRTGDGTVDITTGTGHFFVYVESDVADVSSPEYIAVTTTTLDVWDQILDAVQSRVRALSLTDVTSARVIAQTVVDERFIEGLASADGAAIIIAPTGGERAEPSDSASDEDQLAYPVIIAMLVPANQPQTSAATLTFRRQWFLARQYIRRALISQPLAVADANVWTARLQPAPPVVREWWKRHALASPLFFDFVSLEPRGLGA